MGMPHHNTAQEMCVYKFHFPDGRTEELAANVIAEAVYAQRDAGSNQYVLLDSIVNYHKDPSAAMTCNKQVLVIDGKKFVKCYTKGWKLCYK